LSRDVELWIAVDGHTERNLADVSVGLVDVGLLEAAEVEERRHELAENSGQQRQQLPQT